jgi:sigma-B regulation protein RsbU (phosphoserine phosphatase)
MATNQGALLIVDDDQANRAILRHFLESKGFEITDAADGGQALDWVARRPFDLVLLDVVMPGPSGLETLRSIRQTHAITDLPVILATAKDKSTDIVGGLELGANDYVTKPFDFPVVLARIQTQLALKRSVDRIKALEKSLERRNAELEQANRRMKSDLEAAAKVQKALLPAALPQVQGADFAWRYEPCAELAGDLINVALLGGKYVVLCVLDVVGHGVKAALLAVMVSRALARMVGPSGGPASPAVVAAQLNDEFPWDAETEQYFTMLYGILDLGAGRFRFISAGHPGPLYLPRDGAAQLLKVPGSAIGLGDGRYEEQGLTLKPGDRLYLFSDGLPDAMNDEHQRFGEERLCLSLEHGRTTPLREGLNDLLRCVEAWCGPTPPHDDISVLVVERS